MNNVLKKAYFIVLLIFIILNISSFSRQREKITLAVLEFKVIGRINAGENFGKGIQEILMTNLGQNGNIKVVERSRLSSVIKELSYTGNDLYNYKKAVKLGKLLQARYIVTGSIVGMGNNIRVNARIIEVKTGSIYRTFFQNSRGIDNIFNALENVSIDIEAGFMGINASISEKAPKIEIAFVIDSTGSMHDEINAVRSKINTILNKTGNANPRPLVRIAVIDYKDTYDEYVTKVFKFTSDLNRLRRHLNSIAASGGGDYEESVCDGLSRAIKDLKWSKTGASKMIFLIGDAPAKRKNLYRISGLIKSAARKGISIYTIACSGLDKTGVSFFKRLTKNTNARFSYLSYKQEYITRSGERGEIVTRGHDVYKRRIRRGHKKPLSVEEAGDRFKNRKWTRGGKPGKGFRKYKKSYGGADRGKVLSSESVRIKNSRKIGKMENNLDDILVSSIQKKASRDLNLKYLNKGKTKAAGACLVINKGIRAWAFINKIKDFKQIKQALGKKIWVYAGVKKADNAFILINLEKSRRFIPSFAKKDFINVKKRVNYFENNGITNLNKWFFQVKILKIIKLNK